MVTIYYVIDEMLAAVAYEDDRRSQVSATEIVTVAVIAAQYFHNHWERALCILIQRGDITAITISRFNCRLHRLYDWLYGMVSSLGQLFTGGDVYIIDSMPTPVCSSFQYLRLPIKVYILSMSVQAPMSQICRIIEFSNKLRRDGQSWIEY